MVPALSKVVVAQSLIQASIPGGDAAQRLAG